MQPPVRSIPVIQRRMRQHQLPSAMEEGLRRTPFSTPPMRPAVSASCGMENEGVWQREGPHEPYHSARSKAETACR